MTPSRLYHRRPRLCSVLGAHRNAAKPRTKRAALRSPQASVYPRDPIPNQDPSARSADRSRRPGKHRRDAYATLD